MIVRSVLAVLGVAAGAYGVWLLLCTVPPRSLVLLVVWLAAALMLHDALWSPGLVGIGVLLTRVPPRARRFLQGGLIVSGCLLVVGVPLTLAQGRQPESTTILVQDVRGHLALLLVLVVLVSSGGWVWSVGRDRWRIRRQQTRCQQTKVAGNRPDGSGSGG